MRAILFIAVLAGCNAGESRISILLTDAPGKPDAAVVTIDQIYLQGEQGRVVLRDAPFTTNLLTLSDDVTTLVEDTSVPAGTYDQLRFVIGGGYISVDGAIYATPDYAIPSGSTLAGTLRTPSWDRSGFKVGLPDGGLTIEDQQRVLVVDFNVGESFGQQLGNGDWMMRPVLHAFDFLATGSITVVANVRDVSVTQPIVVALADAAGNRQAEHSVTDDDKNGDITTSFRFLDPRQAPFTLTLQDAVTAPATPMAVSLGSGQAVDVDLDVVSIQTN